MSLQQQKKAIVFIDTRVEDYQILLQEVEPTAEVIVFSPKQDGIEEITFLLAHRKNIQSLHIISHGSPAEIQLGNTKLNVNTITQYTPQIQQWKTAFTKNANLLLYGCNVARGSVGKSFIHHLAHLAKIDVAASNDLTGNAALGGNWNLDVRIGKIETPLCLSAEAIANYKGILSEPAINFTGIFVENGEISYEAPGANDPNTIYTMNYAGNNNTFNSFNIVTPNDGTIPYEIIKNLDVLEIQRKDNPQVQGNRDILWFDGAANGTTINLNSGYNSSMEVALKTPILNLGTDNVFTNAENTNDNNNNIERIDFIEPGGLISPTANNSIGFILVERGSVGLNDPVIITPILEIDEQNNPTVFGGLINISDGDWGNSGLPDVIPQITRKDVNDNVQQEEMRWSFASTTQSIGGVYVSFADLGINPGETFYGYAIFPADITADMDLIGLSDVPLNTTQELGGLDVITGGLLASAINISPTSSNSNVTTLEDTSYSFVAADFPFNDLNTGDSLQTVKITSLPTQGILNLSGQAVTIDQIIPITEIGLLTFASPLNANGDNYANFSFQVSDGTDFSGNNILTVNVTPVNDAPEINNLNNNPSYTLGGNPVVLDNNAIINDVELDVANNYAGSTLTLTRNGGANSNDVFSESGTLGALTPGENLTLNGTVIGSVTDNSGGQLLLTFTNATATQVDTVLQQIAYSNSGDTSETVTINYTFNDGNTGAQGTGGALTATGSLTVNINTPPNEPPTATNDTATTQQDTPVILNPLNNDTDPNG
ncbi:DUF4347 domain-containing protein, partial [Planktothrix serta]|uniref:DUF4347 domain-containing protein n=1 Tax=Planktothrix serta TaxID=1678310 RepID=UPI0012DBCF69